MWQKHVSFRPLWWSNFQFVILGHQIFKNSDHKNPTGQIRWPIIFSHRIWYEELKSYQYVNISAYWEFWVFIVPGWRILPIWPECPEGQCPARVDIGSSRSEKWNGNLVHSFREVKSEMKIWFTHFKNEKWNENALISRSRVKSEMKMSQNRDREWKVNWKCLEIEIEKWNFSRIFEKFREILENQEIKKISNFVTNAFHLANVYSGIQQNAISESICHRGFWGWSLVETCMAVWMASFYWHRRAALIAEVRPEVHPIHPVQSTYGFWTFKPVYTYFRSIRASQLQSMAFWSLLNFFLLSLH